MNQPSVTKSEWISSALTRYEGSLLRYATRLIGDVDQARDIVQDTFLRLCREDPARLDGRLAQWLFTVCRNRAVDIRRKEGRSQPLEESPLTERPSPEPTPARALEDQERLRGILDALATLPGSQQEVLRLKFQQGLRCRAPQPRTKRVG